MASRWVVLANKAGGRGGNFFRGDAVRVAVSAFHKVDVVLAIFVLEGGIHFFDVETAIRKTWMTGAAGGARLQPVLGVARHATEPFMNTDRGAVVARVNL